MHRSLIKKIILLSLTFFFLASLAIAFHHHDNTFLLAARSICKAKAAISGTTGKIKSDPATAVSVVSVGGVVYPLSVTVVAEYTTTISSQSSYIWPNKAPPAKS